MEDSLLIMCSYILVIQMCADKIKRKLGGQEFLIFLKAKFLVFLIAQKITQIPKGLAIG